MEWFELGSNVALSVSWTLNFHLTGTSVNNFSPLA